VIFSLHLYHRLLQACQDLLCLQQPQLKVRDIAKSAVRSDISHVDDPGRAVEARFNQTQDPRRPLTPSQQPIGQSYRLRPRPPTRRTLPVDRLAVRGRCLTGNLIPR
jgi:hypothetical protein